MLRSLVCRKKTEWGQRQHAVTPALSARQALPPTAHSHCVRISTPPSVTSSVCSHCADRLPSVVTAVQPSAQYRSRVLPAQARAQDAAVQARHIRQHAPSSGRTRHPAPCPAGFTRAQGLPLWPTAGQHGLDGEGHAWLQHPGVVVPGSGDRGRVGAGAPPLGSGSTAARCARRVSGQQPWPRCRRRVSHDT